MPSDHPRPRRAAFGALKMIALAALVFSGGALAPTIAGAVIGSGSRDVFVPVTPARIFDTRDGTGLTPATPKKIGAGEIVEVTVRGRGGVSATATAVVMNVTALNASSLSHLTVYPGGTAAPDASSLNFKAGEVVPNSVTVKIGANGKVALRNNAGTVDVFTDVNGYYEDHNHDDRYYTKTQLDTKGTGSAAIAINKAVAAHDCISVHLISYDGPAIPAGRIFTARPTGGTLPAAFFVEPAVYRSGSPKFSVCNGNDVSGVVINSTITWTLEWDLQP